MHRRERERETLWTVLLAVSLCIFSPFFSRGDVMVAETTQHSFDG